MKGEHPLYSLSWTFVFPHSRDRCYFAHCYPYTYTDLQEYLSKLCKDPGRAQYCKQRTLTRTLAGNFVYLMTITSPSKCPLEAKRKRAVVITARVHPGETNSSWMMKGLLDYLTSDTLDAKLLRDTFVFKVVPMLNPDGVVVGNYRCSLTGRDLNRNYKTTLKEAFPSVWHTREMIKRLSQEREITLYCDLHGHSRQQNVFIYGCEDRRNLNQGFKERVFPMMMSKNCKDKFCFKRCKFNVQKSKSGTGRVVMWNLGISNSYTMEATFCGSTLGARAGEHFTTADFESMGYHLCDTLLDYCDPDMSKYFSILNEVEVYVKSLVLERMKEKGVAKPGMKASDVDLERDYVSSQSSSDGSDSSVSDGLPMHIIYSEKEASKKKKKHLKTRKERNKRRVQHWNKQSKEKQPPKQLGNDDVQPVNNNRVNDLPREGRKSSRPSTRERSTKTPTTSISHDACKAPTTAEQFCEVKLQDYVDPLSDPRQNQSPLSFYGQSIPQLRYTDKQVCFGLAPTTPTRSFNRWSVHGRKATSDVTEDDDESNFIGRYMSKQIRLTIQRKDNNKTSSVKQEPSEVVRKLHRCNASYKMIATAQAGSWEGRIEEVRAHKDDRGRYCAHHAAMLAKKAGKERKFEQPIVQAANSFTSKVPLSHESIGSKRSLPDSSNVKQGNGRTRAPNRAASLTQEGYEKTSLDKRSNSDCSFPVVCAQRVKAKDRNHETRLFNFSGVQKPSNAEYKLSREHRNSSSTDNGYFSFVDSKDGQANQRTWSQAPRPSVSDTSTAQPTQELHTRKNVRCVDKSGTNFLFDKDGLTFDQSLQTASEELAMEAVGRLRKKIQHLNSPGCMVSYALNNQLNDVEEDIQKSLLDEYRNFQSQHQGGHTKTISKSKHDSSKRKPRQKKDFEP